MLLPLVLAALALSPEVPVSSNVLRNSPGLQSRPSIATDGRDFFAAWEHDSTFLQSSGDVVGTRIRADGEVLDTAGGIPLQPIWVADMEPVVVWNGTTYAVAIEDGPAPWPYGVKVVEVTRDGTVLGEKWLVTPRDITSMDFAWNGTEYLLVWRQEPGSVRARRYDRPFDPIGDELILAGDGVEVAATSNGVGFLAAWTTTAHKAFASNLTSPANEIVASSATSIDAASNGTSYAVFANDVVMLDANAAITGRTPMPASIDDTIAWTGTRWLTAWSAGDRVFTQPLDGSAPQRVSNADSLQRSPALATTASGTTIVLWSDAPPDQPYRADIRRAFLGNATNTSLVSTGLADQTPLALAWSDSTLGVLWNEGDGFGARMRLGQLQPDGVLMTGEGEAFEPATEAVLASNGSTFAIAAVRDGRVEVDLPAATRIVLGEGTLPRIASDGRDYFVAWARGLDAVGRRVLADGTLGPIVTLPRADNGEKQTPQGLVFANGSYVVLTLEAHGLTSFALISTPVSAAGEAGTPQIFFHGGTLRGNIITRMATNGTDVLYAWSTLFIGTMAQLGLTGTPMQIDPQAWLEDVSFARGEPLFLLGTSEGRFLVRGGERVALGNTFPMHLAGNAVMYKRAIDRIPGFPDLAADRAFVRFVVDARRRGIRH